MTDIQKLKALAEAAPTGPWECENDSLYFKDDGYTRHLLDADSGSDVEEDAYYAALKFIAAANPAAVLELIAEIDRLEERNVYWIDQANTIARDRNSIRTQRDQLKAENEALVTALNDILRVTPMGVEAFGIAALVLGELGVSKEADNG